MILSISATTSEKSVVRSRRAYVLLGGSAVTSFTFQHSNGTATEQRAKPNHVKPPHPMKAPFHHSLTNHRQSNTQPSNPSTPLHPSARTHCPASQTKSIFPNSPRTSYDKHFVWPPEICSKLLALATVRYRIGPHVGT